MHRADLGRAQSELKTAKRIVSERNGLGEACVVRVSPVKMPRVWPNAVPGGTSPGRALRQRVLAWERVAYPMKARPRRAKSWSCASADRYYA
jgi:hypothetical protein